MEFVKNDRFYFSYIYITTTLCLGIKGSISQIMSVYICRQSSPVEVDVIDITVSLRLKDHEEKGIPVRVLNLYICPHKQVVVDGHLSHRENDVYSLYYKK